MDITVFVIGALLIMFSLWISAASNFLSRLVLKITPFFMGLFLIYYAAIALGWI